MTKALPYLQALLLSSMALFGISAEAQTWEILNPTPFYKHHSNAFTYEGKAYVFEGVLTNDLSQAMWTYDPVEDEWSNIADFPGPARAIAIGDEWDGKYYYGFGRTDQTYLRDLWVFDPADSSFTELATCPCTGRTHPALVAYRGKVFMGTGSTGFGDLTDWWVYDIATDTWEQKRDLPGGRRHHPFFFTEGDFVYVGGGHQSTWYKWNIEDEIWTRINGEPLGRVAGQQFQHNGFGYVLGGDDTNHDHVPQDESFMRYDPATDEWEKLPVTPRGKWAPSSFVLDDYVYYFGGLSSELRNDRTMMRLNLELLDQISSTTEVEASALQLHPNPSQSGTFHADFTTTNAADWDVRFFDVTGREVTQSFTVNGNGEYASAAKGTFIFSGTHIDGRTARRLVVLQ